MDSGSKKRLLWNFLSNWVSRLSSTNIQLVGVPVFLHFWSVPLYGNWITVTSIPSYLSFSSVGFGCAPERSHTVTVPSRCGAATLLPSALIATRPKLPSILSSS